MVVTVLWVVCCFGTHSLGHEANQSIKRISGSVAEAAACGRPARRLMLWRRGRLGVGTVEAWHGCGGRGGLGLKIFPNCEAASEMTTLIGAACPTTKRRGQLQARLEEAPVEAGRAAEPRCGGSRRGGGSDAADQAGVVRGHDGQANRGVLPSDRVVLSSFLSSFDLHVN